MKKIRLKQPYAALVISGLLKRIPYIWVKYEKDEPIFIYAEERDDNTPDGKLDVCNEFHKKLYNGVLMGNVIKNDLEIDGYIGYVTADYLSAEDCTWLGKSMESLYVHNPHRFTEIESSYTKSFNSLRQLETIPVEPKKIVRQHHNLIVPVGETTWRKLNKWNNKGKQRNYMVFDEAFLFIESGIRRYLYDGNGKEIVISRVTFQFKCSSIIFDARGTEIENIIFDVEEEFTDEDVDVLHFRLKYLPKSKRSNDEEAFCDELVRKLRIVNEQLKPKSIPTQIISIPMGKMNKRK